MRALAKRLAFAALGAALLLGITSAAPLLLRKLPAFRVSKVEVTGTHWLAPSEALVASGIDRTSNVFDDPAPWLEKLSAHPLVAAVRIERRLPSTLRVHITEAAPAALARTPELRAVDARGRILPLDPAGTRLDLPVLGAESKPDADGRLADDASLALLDALNALNALEPGLATLVSEALPARDGSIRLRLRAPAAGELVVPRQPDSIRLREVRIALADLERRSELHRLRRIDARFDDQLVVALAPESR